MYVERRMPMYVIDDRAALARMTKSQAILLHYISAPCPDNKLFYAADEGENCVCTATEGIVCTSGDAGCYCPPNTLLDSQGACVPIFDCPGE